MMYQSTTKQPLESICGHYRVLLLRYLTILCLVLVSSSINAEVNITTIDDFSIYSTSEHDLIVNKSGLKDRTNFLAFRMDRPFCICANPVISLMASEKVEVGSRIKGQITIDLKRPMDTLLQVLQKFESGHVLFRPLQFPSLRSSKVVSVKTENGTSATFITNGIDSAMAQSKRMCESNFYFEAVEPKVKEMDV